MKLSITVYLHYEPFLCILTSNTTREVANEYLKTYKQKLMIEKRFLITTANNKDIYHPSSDFRNVTFHKTKDYILSLYNSQATT